MNENKLQLYQVEELFIEQSETPCEADIGLTETELKDDLPSRGLLVQLPESGEGLYG